MSRQKTMEIVLGVALLLSAVSVPYPLIVLRRGSTSQGPISQGTFQVQIDRLEDLHRQTVSQRDELNRLNQEAQALILVLGDASVNSELESMAANPQRKSENLR